MRFRARCRAGSCIISGSVKGLFSFVSRNSVICMIPGESESLALFFFFGLNCRSGAFNCPACGDVHPYSTVSRYTSGRSRARRVSICVLFDLVFLKVFYCKIWFSR